MWAGRLWWYPEEYLRNVPRDIVQSNWYYSDRFDFAGEDPARGGTPLAPATAVAAYARLESAGFDQIPCGGNFEAASNMALTVDHCTRVVSADRLLGYLAAPWRPTVEAYRPQLMSTADEIAAARRQAGSAPAR